MKKEETREKKLIVAAIRGALALSASALLPVYGQEAQTTDKLQEVVIYGKYRPEDQTTATGLGLPLIDTPQSISIVSKEMLDEFNMSTAYDAVDMVPGASQEFNGFGAQEVFVRGQQVVPRVNAFVMPSSVLLDSYGLERIEFVRGPATVLYGITSAFGGEMNQILKKPTADFRAEAGYQAGDFANRRIYGDVSGAVPGTDDRLKARLVGTYTEYGIFQDISVPAHNINSFVLADASYAITPATNVGIFFYDQKQSRDPTDGCPMARTPSGVLYIPTSIPVERWYCSNPKQSRSHANNTFEQLKLAHNMSNDWTLEANVVRSKTTAGVDYVLGFGPAGASGLAPTDVQLYGYAQDSDYVVVVSNVTLGGKFDLWGRTQQFFAALEYQDQRQDIYPSTGGGLGIMNLFQDGGLGILANGDPIPLNPTVWAGDGYTRVRQTIGSVQVLLNPVARLDVLVGGLVQRLDEASEFFPNGAPVSGARLSQTYVIPRLAITYDLLSQGGSWLTDAKLYVSQAQGVLPNVGIYDAQHNPLTSPQTMRSYEAGLKTTWLNGKLDMVVDAFHSYVTNIPDVAFSSFVGSFVTTLGAKNTFDGAEFQLIGEAARGWNIDLSYSYIKALQQSELLPTKLAVPDTPRQQASVFTSYKILSGPLSGLLFGTGIAWKNDVPIIGSPQDFYFNHYDPSNQLLWSATTYQFNISYDGFPGRWKGLSVFGNVTNAFDARTWNGAGYPSVGNVTGPPRAMTIGLKYKL